MLGTSLANAATGDARERELSCARRLQEQFMQTPTRDVTSRSTIVMILGGGRGQRLFPLTKDRSKPAVPIGAKFRFVDIPISNCINSGLLQIYVLTQFNSKSLNNHCALTYKFDAFTRGFVAVLAAEQRYDSEDWYQGTADAVRQNLRYIQDPVLERVLILSGDQLYRMDYRDLLRTHQETEADATVAVLPVSREDATRFGILKVGPSGRIVDFAEKPKDPGVLDRFSLTSKEAARLGVDGQKNTLLGSMGIYVFQKAALERLLEGTETDFGTHVFPRALQQMKVFAHVFDGYWSDIGTIRSFYEANLALTDPKPAFSFYDPDRPIYTHPRFLPPSSIERATLRQVLLSEGCVVYGAEIERSVVGIRSVIQPGARIRDSVIFGADAFETAATHEANARKRIPNVGIGRDCRIERAIIDKNARIGDGAILRNADGVAEMDGDGWYIRDGLIVVPKGATVQPGAIV
jgi:glucose-1-phosphate adenylyltransferase